MTATILAAAGGLVVLAGAGAALVKLFGLWRKVSGFIDEVVGVPAQFGREARPGVIERMDRHEELLGSMHHELHPNSGLSLRDAVDRTEAALKDHLENCSPPPPVQVNVNPGG